MPEQPLQFETMTANEVEYDHEQGVIVHHTEWFPGLLDTVKHLHNTGQWGPLDMRVLMHIPGVVIEAWCNQQRIAFDDFTRDEAIRRRFLNDPDLAAFRVYKGRV